MFTRSLMLIALCRCTCSTVVGVQTCGQDLQDLLAVVSLLTRERQHACDKWGGD